ncbi:MAG: tetratricopeptide repeat protein [Bacteroidota bacterium]
MKIDEARSLFNENPKKALTIAFQAHHLAEASQNIRLVAFSLNTIGSAYNYVGDNDSAIYYHQQALSFQEQIHDDLGIGRSLTNLGIAYTSNSLNDKAIKCFLEAEQKFIKIKFDVGLSKLYNSMGALFYNINDFRNSINYYKKGIAISKKLDDTGLNYSLKINLANVYGSINHPKEALALYKESYVAAKADSNYSGLIMVCNNMCHQYLDLRNFTLAKHYCDEALSIIQQHLIEDYLKTTTFSNQADILSHDGRFSEAVLFVDSALSMLKSSPDINKEIGLKYQLGKMLHKSGNNERSYEVLIDALNLKDSVYAKNLKEKLSEINTVHEVEKKESQIQLLSSAQEKQKVINRLLFGVACISLLALVILVSSYKRKQRDNEIIRLQKNEVVSKNILVEKKQQEISDSINYAKRIQTSFLANKIEFEKHFADYFILFEPKDVVSGDFYWTCAVESKLFVGIADSTGHGIPGAFMSLLNISLLNEAVLSRNYNSTIDILNFVRRILILGLKPDEMGQGGNDGMDCAIFAIDFQTLEMEFSGANNPLWIVRENAVMELKPDKMPVGRSPKEFVPFTSQKFQLKKDDLIYGFTDGFADQFGGPKGKKFKYKQLEDAILANHHYLLSVQNATLMEALKSWKGDLEQVDDVTILGFKV